MQDYAVHWREDGSSRRYAGYMRLGALSTQLVGRVGDGPRWVLTVRFENIQSVSLSNEKLRLVPKHGPAIEVQSDDGVEALQALAQRIAAGAPRSVSVTLEAA